MTQYRLKLADKDKELSAVTAELEEVKTKNERQAHLINVSNIHSYSCLTVQRVEGLF